MKNGNAFNELAFFADVKQRPGLYLGTPSLLSLRDYLSGMEHAFQFYEEETPLRCFRGFTNWYQEKVLEDRNGYACWWNHLLYTSGNDDRYALERFFELFERYLHDAHGLKLPDGAAG